MVPTLMAMLPKTSVAVVLVLGIIMSSVGAIWVAFSPNALEAVALPKVTRTVDDATPDPGQIVTVTITPSDFSDFYATREELGTLSVQGHTADGLTSGAFVMLGATSFTYRVKIPATARHDDEFPLSGVWWSNPASTSTVSPSVTTLKVFRPATAFDDATSTVEDATASILIDVMNNDANADGLEIVEISGGIGKTSTTTVGATTVVSYLPAPDFNGEDQFNYRISDGHASSSARVTVIVQPVNDAPKAVADSATTSFRTPVVVDVLANDSDIDNDPLRVSTFGQGLNGSVTTSDILIDGRQALLFTPDVEFVGVDFFSYAVSDPTGVTDSATATVLVTPSSPPTANADTATTSEDISVAINALSNDTDPDGDVLRILETPTGASLGSVATTSQDSIIYNPYANVHGTDSFVYTITDDRGGSSSSTVTVIIHPVNDLPTARQDSGRTRVNTP
jgi:hypothetical protein